MSIAAVILCAAVLGGDPAASDWCTTGPDCVLFAAADVDGDGRADVLTINGARELCVAYTVEGWKSAGWEVLAEGVEDGALWLAAGAATDGPGSVRVAYADRTVVYAALQGGRLTARSDGPPAERGLLAESPWAIAPPPYEPFARQLATFAGDATGDGRADAFGVFEATEPHAHRAVRLCVAPDPSHGDLDADGLADAAEAELGTDPLDRDTDDDGLLDGWEANGLPRGIALGPGAALSPRHQDVLVAISPYAQLARDDLDRELVKVARLYAELGTENPDGTTGIRLHFRVDASVPEDRQHEGSWSAVGVEQFAPHERGVMHWMQVTPWGGGQAQQTGDMGGSGCNWACFAHEFGHQLSLSHEGDSAAAWCPLYPSLMNYAFSYSLGGDAGAIRFSRGRFRGVTLDERRLVERLPFPYPELRYLEAPPFRFRLEDDGAGGTRIDWNQNGTFDAEPVAADVNYGGSTYCGVRRDAHAIGGAPALAYVGGSCWLATADVAGASIELREHRGDETWSEPRRVPGSATRFDPVLAGGAEHGFLMFRQLDGWHAARIAGGAVEGPAAIPGLQSGEVAAVAVGDRLLLVIRRDDDRLAARWLDWNGGAPAVGAEQVLDVRSQVPVGLALAPDGRRIALAGAMPNSRGTSHCLRVTWLELAGERVVERETAWTRGEASGNQCTTRPVVTFNDAAELFVFHTGWPSADGLMTAWRTQSVGNRALDEGWLTALLYDVWTLTRAGVGFAAGPQGALFAFRWDAGDGTSGKRNHLLLAYNGFGVDAVAMRDFDDGAKIARWGIRHSILNMRRTVAR